MVMGEFTLETDVLVIGAGPGGYAAAFRAADLGLDVTMIDTAPRPGGVCLFRGCIPSKTYLHVTELLHDAANAQELGITFGEPKIDLNRLRQWKNEVVDRLSMGLVELCKKRSVQYFTGRAMFESSDHVRLQGGEVSRLKFKHAIIATGSKARALPNVPFKPKGRVMSSTGALELPDIPEKLLVVGGGYVGVELGSVYAELGSRVTVIDGLDRLMSGADKDLVQPLMRRLEALFHEIHYGVKISEINEQLDRVEVVMEGPSIKESRQVFDRVLVAIGRGPNSADIGLENTGVKTDKRGFIIVDEQMRTSDERIFAIGDVVGGAMLAHKAMHEGKVAAEVIAGEPSAFDFQAIPAVVYTDPQMAWCGLTEDEAKKQNRPVKISRFPWSASGRAVSMGVQKGMTKLIVDLETERVLGMGIVGRDAGEMISEGVLAVEMGALAQDVALSIHPHPTLSEGEGEAAEVFLGSSTHILPQKKK
ncbi:MAG: dihydrolipoyl dehydrogenase [Acidobacteriota bacterium]